MYTLIMSLLLYLYLSVIIIHKHSATLNMTLHDLRILYRTIQEVENNVVIMYLLKNVCKSQMVWTFCHQNVMYMITYRPYRTRNRIRVLDFC